MKYYKGFKPGLICHPNGAMPFQFKEGEWMHVSDEAVLCEKGVHACEAPLDCLAYYGPASSEYHEVELQGVSDKRGEDTKVCATDIKVGAKLSIKNLVDAQIEFVKSKITNTKTNSGIRSVASNSGNESLASNSGDCSVASNSGDCSVASNSGYESVASNSGIRSVASNSGIRSVASNSGNESVAICWGRFGKAKAAIGSYIVLSEWGEWDGEKYPLLCAKMTVVDGETIKADTWYQLKNGEFVEDHES